MPRLVAIVLIGVVLLPAATGSEVAPAPRLPGQPADLDLLNVDIGLLVGLVPPAPEIDTEPPKGFPVLPKLDPANPPKPGEPAAAFEGRFGKDREKLVKANGGNTESEKAVALGLAWLARQQKADGSWVFDGGDKDEVVAATGMALLAFLGAGETHQGNGKYAKTVHAGLNWLLRNLHPAGAKEGRFAGAKTMYAQAIGTLALCEAYGMTRGRPRDNALLEPAQAAVLHIMRQQGANGSWGYSVAAPSNGDTSIAGWQVQALHAAILSKDIVVDARVIKNAVQFLDEVASGSRKESYGYATKGGAPGTSLSAVGLLCRYSIDGWGPDSPGMAAGVLGLMKRAPKTAKGTPEMYFYYYATRVVQLFGDEEWKTWNEGPKGADGVRKGGMRDWLVSTQNTKEGANQGSWEPDGGFIGRGCGRAGTTVLALLTLETYYRYEPASKMKAGDVLKQFDPKKP